jgi:hypothetical protein
MNNKAGRQGGRGGLPRRGGRKRIWGVDTRTLTVQRKRVKRGRKTNGIREGIKAKHAWREGLE